MNTNKSNKTNKIKSKIRHLKAFILVFSLLVIALIVRIFWIQFVKGGELKELAYKQITSSSVISPKRGAILDSTGKTLAVSVDVDTVSINPSLICVKDDDEKTTALKEKVAKAFSDILGVDYNDTLVKVTSLNNVEVIAKKIQKDKIDSLKNWMKDNKVYCGINIDEDNKRYYPYENLASNLIGFCGNDNNGLAGLEYYWNDTLSGTPGRMITSIDAVQDSIPDNNAKYVAPQNGSNITLTIDANIQTIVEKYLKHAVIENNCKNGGCMTLMDPSTGNILAMATYPDYNLNTPFEPNEKLSENWDNLSSEEKTNSLYTMYRNKVVSDTYEPGSCFKIITASAGLEEAAVETDTPNDFYCGGYEDVSGIKIHCTRTNGHGSETLRNALENSCNPALIQLGKRIGATTLYKYLQAFGLFDKTGIATIGEASSNFHDLENVGPVELATTCFGQRFTITPLQMITAASAIANGGTLVQPKIVSKIENSDTGVINNIDTTVVRQVISKGTAAKICNMMQSVVTDGGGQSGAVIGYSIGGKTGTSEPDPNHPENGYVSSFLAIAPVENTRVVALLSLFGPQGKNYYGGQIAAPVVSQVLSEVLPYLNIPSNDATESNIDSNLVTVPDLKGKNVKEAKEILENLGLVCVTKSKSDDIVTIQNPKSGVSLCKSSIVILYSDGNDATVSVAVPNLKDKTASQAKSILKSKNLNIQVTGEGIVVSQDPPIGSSISEGSVVKVTLQEVTSDLH